MTHADKVKEFYREQGRQIERERIIALLENRSKCSYEHDYNGYCYCEEIELIRETA